MEALVSIKEEEKINNKISKINLTLVLRVRRFHHDRRCRHHHAEIVKIVKITNSGWYLKKRKISTKKYKKKAIKKTKNNLS